VAASGVSESDRRASRARGVERLDACRVILDCIVDSARAFYQHWDFRPLPGHPMRLFLSWNPLEALATGR
jgi:hypothetical protein